MVKTANLGFPRIGSNRELKKALEGYWKGKISISELEQVAKEIRKKNWLMQQKAGIDFIPSNDFSFYDQVLDMICMLGAYPQEYQNQATSLNQQDLYFAMARGRQENEIDLKAMEMTKWFDTNYHYIVPEFKIGQTFNLNETKILEEYKEALALGVKTRPVVIGAVTFLSIGKIKGKEFNRFELVNDLLPIYNSLLQKLAEHGVEWIQIDEPCLVLDLTEQQKLAYKAVYEELSKSAKEFNIKLMVTTYFEGVNDNLDLLCNLPVDGVHIDFVRGDDNLNEVISKLKKNTILSLGVVDGRNIWVNDLSASCELVKQAIDVLGEERVLVAPSCSLLHSPVDVSVENKLDAEIKSWLAFATQKLEELNMIKQYFLGDEAVVASRTRLILEKKNSSKVINQDLRSSLDKIEERDYNRNIGFKERIKIQEKELSLPKLPTTTIGSYPQTKEVRKFRADFKKKRISQEEYNDFIKEETKKVIKIQEEIGLDVLVHGEFERNDMVEYFGEQLKGFAFTANGWVQSYGSRCVKPPIIYGDVVREKPMTVEWAVYANSLTNKIIKGMLTGPVTILQWSFVRDDQPRSETCKQIAYAIRQEVLDLEKADIKIIQIDEAALREGVPLRKKKKDAYLKWAIDSFRLSANGVNDVTQIHTHMCYSEFNDIIKHIATMDADVISIEASRSDMELLNSFVSFKYPNQVGPGMYDIHSPRVPSLKEVKQLIYKALEVLPAEQLWINPDCGLKTRDWLEVKQALKNMVIATKQVREEI